MTTALARVDTRQLSVEKACEILERCKSIDEAKEIRDQALAVSIYLREKKAATAARDDAFEIALRAERRMGALLATTELHKGGREADHGKRRRRKDATGAQERPVRLRDLGVSKGESRRAQRLAALPAAEFDGRVRAARATDKLSFKAVLSTTAATDHDGDEWMTDEEMAGKAQRVLGAIDLDPASSAEANNVIKARRFFTKEQNGLTKKWTGRVWLNPPFSAALVVRFVEQLVTSYERGDVPAAILLVNASTDVSWFQDLCERYPVCLTRGRRSFTAPGGRRVKGNMYGQAIFFLGCKWPDVRREFGDVGVLMEAAS